MLKYHITDDYKVARCTADKVKCKYDKGNSTISHFSSESEAIAAAEKMFENNYETKSVTKSAEDDSTISYHEISVKDDGTSVFMERHKPSIYGFISTKLNEANDAYIVKVGYTSRTVPQRMKEWQDEGGIYSPEYFQLEFELPAVITDPENGKEYYVMDHNFHKYFEKNGFQKLIDREFDSAGHDKKKISKEFYIGEDGKKQITREIIDECVADQEQNLHNGGSGYTFYDENTSQRMTTQYRPTLDFQPRSFQNEVINRSSSYFLNSSNNDEDKRFLLTAPTRSGKSFMAAQTLLKTFNEAKELDPSKKNHCAVVVSGFAEIEDEWKKTFQTHKDFNQKEYGTAETNKCGESPCVCTTKFKYLSKMDLENNPKAVEEAYANGAENVVVFFTLQDLAGSTSGKGVKTVHKFLNTPGSVDMLLGDEAHLAMFTEDGRYQEILNGYSEDHDVNEKIDNATLNVQEEIESSTRLQRIKPTIGSLFISATPYNVLTNTSKFDIDKNVIIIPEEQIIDEQKAWEDKNRDKEVWESPYYGIPTKKFFGLDVGISADQLFSPVDKQNGRKGFKHPQQIKQVISGLFGRGGIAPNIMKDTNFEAAGIGNHIYVTLPYCSSCDAMEAELNKFLKTNNLDDEYEILNISSVDKANHPVSKLSSNEINGMITNSGKKTITLTVDRMGTGVTQEKWDTVIMMRGMSSAQKYDQVAGRCGTPYVKTYETTNSIDSTMCQSCGNREIRETGKKLCQQCFDKGGENLEESYAYKVIKDNPKPNVAIVTFDPDAMVNFARNKAVTLAGNEGKTTDEQTSGEQVDKNIERSLNYIEHFIYKKDKTALQKLDKHNIMSVVLQGMKDKSVGDIADSLNIHSSIEVLDDDAKNVLSNINSTNFTKEDKTKVTSSVEKRDDGECWVEECDNAVRKGVTSKGNPHRLCEMHYEEEKERRAANKTHVEEEEGVDYDIDEEFSESVNRKEQKYYEEKIKSAYSRTLFYAMLSDKKAPGLNTVIENIRNDQPTEENGFTEGRAAELARHMGVEVEVLETIRDNKIGGLDFDDAIRQMGRILADDDKVELPKRDKFNMALKSFSMLSSNEILTSPEVSKMLIGKLNIKRQDWKNFKKSSIGTMDVGCKSAVNLVEFYESGLKNGLKHDDMKNKLYSVPTSAMSYELISKIYDEYGWNKSNILFVDGINNIDTLNAMSLAKEKVSCQAKDPEVCLYHKSVKNGGKGTVSARLNIAEAEIFDKIKDEDTKIRLRALMKQVEDMPKFDYVISNPPYQLDTGTGQQGRKIYQEFWWAGKNIGHKTSMIFMNGWQSGKELVFKDMRNDKSITQVDNYYEDKKVNDQIIFPTALTGGVSVLVSDDTHTTGPVFKEYGKEVATNLYKNAPENKQAHWILDKAKDLGLSKLKITGNGQNGYAGISTKHIVGNPNFVIQRGFEDGGEIKNTNESGITLVSSNSVGKSGRAAIYHTSKEELVDNISEVEKFKVVSPVSWKPTILHPNVMPGRIRPVVKTFDTHKEAKNFANFMKTKFSQHFKADTPDLGDYSDDNPEINWKMPLDQQLYRMFKLSDEEIQKIEN